MPIDFDAIARDFRRRIARDLALVLESFKRLSLVVRKTVDANEKLERATRHFPVLDFNEDALTVSVGSFHHGVLPPFEARPSPGAVARFRAGLGRIPDAVEEELAIPRVLLTVLEMVEAIVASLERWDRPTPAMFDVTIPRRGSDLIGQAFLFAESLASSTEQIRVVANSRLAWAIARSLGQPSAATPGGGGVSLEAVLRAMIAALLVVPLAGLWLDAFLQSALLGIKVRALAGFEHVERSLHRLRASLIETFYTQLMAIGHTAWAFAEAGAVVIQNNLRYVGHAAMAFAGAWLNSIVVYVRGWTSALRHYAGIAEDLRDDIERIFNFDIGAWITDKLGLPTISLTLGDYLKATLGIGSAVVISSLRGALFLASLSLFGPLRRRATAALKVLDWLDAGPIPRQAVPLPPPAPSFPNVHAYLFGWRARVDIQDELRSAFRRLPEDVWAVFESGRRATGEMAAAFSGEAGRLARFSSMDRWRAASTRAGEYSDLLFGDQREALRRRIGAQRDPFVEAFDRAIAGGAFHIVGAAIPLYIEAMREFWARERGATGEGGTVATTSAIERDRPTSPHILAQRARLGRVRLPALTIRTTGRVLDDDLIARVAQRFREAVLTAYDRGLERVAVEG